MSAVHLFLSALVPSKLSDPRISSSAGKSHAPTRFNNVNRIIKLIQYCIIHPLYQKHNALLLTAVYIYECGKNSLAHLPSTHPV